MDSDFRQWVCRPPLVVIYHCGRCWEREIAERILPCYARFCYLQHTARRVFYLCRFVCGRTGER